MRLLGLILIVCLLASCSSLKPVVGGPTANSNNSVTRTPSPVFIDNIIINGNNDKPVKSKTSAVEVPGINNVRNTVLVDYNTSPFNPLQFKYAILMDVAVEELTNIKLLEFMEEWYGTRYRFGGSGKDGIDCSAFSGYLMSAVFGVSLPRMAKEQYKFCQHVRRNNLEAGDLVFFHTTRKGVSHVGVYLGNNKFVHASVNYGVTISDMGEGYYHNRFVSGGRPRLSAPAAASAN